MIHMISIFYYTIHKHLRYKTFYAQYNRYYMIHIRYYMIHIAYHAIATSVLICIANYAYMYSTYRNGKKEQEIQFYYSGTAKAEE